MDFIKDTISSVLEDLKKKQKGDVQQKAFELLRKSLTTKEIKHIKPVSFRSGILKLNVDSSVWLYQLNLKKSKIISDIKSQLDDLKDIYLRLGSIK